MAKVNFSNLYSELNQNPSPQIKEFINAISKNPRFATKTHLEFKKERNKDASLVYSGMQIDEMNHIAFITPQKYVGRNYKKYPIKLDIEGDNARIVELDNETQLIAWLKSNVSNDYELGEVVAYNLDESRSMVGKIAAKIDGKYEVKSGMSANIVELVRKPTALELNVYSKGNANKVINQVSLDEAKLYMTDHDFSFDECRGFAVLERTDELMVIEIKDYIRGQKELIEGNAYESDYLLVVDAYGEAVENLTEHKGEHSIAEKLKYYSFDKKEVRRFKDKPGLTIDEVNESLHEYLELAHIA